MPDGKMTPDQQLETLHHVLDAGIISSWDIAIDGGANAGYWSMAMGRRFSKVNAFEPSPTTADRLRKNLAGIDNIEIHEQALFHSDGKGRCYNPPKRKTSTSTYVLMEDDGPIDLVRLDSLALETCGLIKLDLEGAEFDALKGAEATIRRCRPVLIIEITKALRKRYGHEQKDLENFIASFGYSEVFVRGVDHVYAPVTEA